MRVKMPRPSGTITSPSRSRDSARVCARLAVKQNLAAKGFQPGNGADGGAFARAVGADKRGLLALFHAE
jgi:hypothetical protein